MICAKCATPRGRGGRPPTNPRRPATVKMIPLPTVLGVERFQCPHCHAIFVASPLDPQPPQFEQIPLLA